MSDFKLTMSDFDDCSTIICISEKAKEFWCSALLYAQCFSAPLDVRGRTDERIRRSIARFGLLTNPLAGVIPSVERVAKRRESLAERTQSAPRKVLALIGKV